MDTADSLSAKRKAIAREIANIESMRKGVLNEQFVTANKKDGSQIVRGPYYVLTKKGPHGKTVSKAIPAVDADIIRAETENYKRFKQLSEDYIDTCEQLSMLRQARKEGDNV